MGKPATHIVTTLSCDACHTTTAWSPARKFDHVGVAPGTCASCHTGAPPMGKPANHVVTTASCDSCHNTTAWTPANFSHANVSPGTCTTCHGRSGGPPMNQSADHFITTRSCDACHTTSAWQPATAYTHTSPFFKRHNSGVQCRDCHTGNNEVITWKFATYKPDCAGCHTNDFKNGPHKKTEVPTTIYYTVAELKDCSGSCHMYTDNSFTTIKKTRNGEHRSTDGDF
jgi:hypothetical protein